MVFPQTQLGLHAEAYIGTSWTDLVALKDVRASDGVVIRRGLSGEGSSPEPAVCTLTLNNAGGKYSPRNPTGANYGLIGRNTPLRVSVDQATSYLRIDDETGNTPVGGCSVSTPDNAALDITADLDIRIDLDLSSWSEAMELLTKWTDAGNQRSYALILEPTGKLLFWHSTDGTAAGMVGARSTIPVPISSGRLAVRVALDVSDGAGNRVRTFYTSTTGVDGTWTQLGDPVTAVGTTSVFASSAILSLLDNPNSTLGVSMIRGRLYGAQVRNGIAGTVVANPDFTAQSHGATSFADSAGRTWTLNGAVSLQKRDYRFTGEIPAWPIRWDPSGHNVYAPLEAAGVMRRLAQGVAPLQSAMYRGSIKLANLIAYWAAEDGQESASFGSVLAGGTVMAPIGDVQFASNSEFKGSLALPEFNGGRVSGKVANYTNTGANQVRFLLRIPAGGAVNSSVIARVYTTGTAARWDLTYGTGGTLSLSAWDPDGTLISTSGDVGFTVNGKLVRANIQIETSGSDIAYTFGILQAGALAALGSSGTVASRTMGKITNVQLNPKSLLTDTVFGHITVQSLSSNIFDLAPQMQGYSGETAGRRFQRLCREHDLDHVIVGDADETEPMGVQRPMTLLDLLKECAFVDGGQLFEPRDFLGLGLRTRASLQSQPAAVTVPYTSLGQLDPVDDDQQTLNDVTVTRPEGSTSRAVLGTGPLSYLPPPTGVGRYDTQVEVNVDNDTQLPNQAGWRLHIGTVDEPRYPVIRIGQENPRVATSTSLLAQLAVLDLGDRIDVTGPPAWLPPETISQLVVGWTETMGPKERALALVCVPESPYRVTRYAATTALAAAGVPPAAGRYASSGTTLVGSESTTDTTWSISTPSGPRWTTDPTQFPQDWMCEGEQVRVTAISGTTSTQTATVQRSINGVVKAHSAGAVITPLQPAIYG